MVAPISRIVTADVGQTQLFQFLIRDEVLRQGRISLDRGPAHFSVVFGNKCWAIRVESDLSKTGPTQTQVHYEISHGGWCSRIMRTLTSLPDPEVVNRRIEERIRSAQLPPPDDSEGSRRILCHVMDEAWRDHQHTRDQTWKALQMEFVIAAAVVGLNWKISSVYGALISGFVLFILALCGVQITLRHRNRVELDKFRHIMHCEEALGLHRSELIDGVQMPRPISFFQAFNPVKGNTALFILRMHIAILGFSLLFILYSLM